MNRLYLGIAIAGASTAAFAADMPLKASRAPPPLMAPPPYNWNGCYIGGNAGGKWWTNTSGNIDVGPGIVGPFLLLSPISFDVNSNSGSFIGGGQVGCNVQAGQFVFGLEGNADWQHLSRTGTLVETSGEPGLATNGSFSLTSNWQASLRARVGYAADRVLWYATGGAAWTRVSLDGHVSFSVPSFPEEGFATADIVPVSKTAVRGTAGVGVEFAATDQLTLGLEDRYTWYGSQHLNTSAVDSAPALASFNLNTAEVIGKVNWKFGNFAGNEERRERR